jgi:hypothetical protein
MHKFCTTLMEKSVGEIGILNSDLFSDQFFYSVGTGLLYRPARLHRLAESIPNSFEPIPGLLFRFLVVLSLLIVLTKFGA